MGDWCMNKRELWTNFMSGVQEGARVLYDTISHGSPWPNDITIDEFEYLSNIAKGCMEALDKKRKNCSLKDIVKNDLGYDRQVERNYAECELVKFLMTDMGISFKDAIRYFDSRSEKQRVSEYQDKFSEFCIKLKLQMLGGTINAEDVSNMIVAVLSDKKKSKGFSEKVRDGLDADYKVLTCVDKLMNEVGANSVDLQALFDCRANIGAYHKIVLDKNKKIKNKSEIDFETNN